MVNGEVTGSVQTADTTLDYNDVIANRLSRDITLSTRNEAVKNIREVLSDTRRYGQFASHRTGKAGTVKLGNDKLSLEISNQGGYISRATLLDYKSYLPADAKSEKIDTADVEICRPGCNKYSFELTSATQRINTADFFFTPRQVSDSVVEMTLDMAGGGQFGFRYTLPKGSYVVRMEMIQTVSYTHLGDEASIEDHMGFIKLGSRVDLYLPLDTTIKVNLGDKTVGGITEVGRLSHADDKPAN